MSSPKVSVHIVTYNSEKYIDQCLKAVLAQSYNITQIILVDNASSDSTLEILSNYHSSIKLITNTSNKGFAFGHNQAIKESSCDYFLILNPDVVPHPDYVYLLIKNAELSKGFGSFTGKLLFKNSPDKIDSTGLMVTKARRAFDRGVGDHSAKWNTMGHVFGVSGAAALYSRKMVEDVSIDGEFFDEDFFAYKEDVDVAWRAQLFGWGALYVPEATAYHERGWKKDSRKNQPLFIRRFSYINRYRMIIKNESYLYILLHSIFILPYEISSLGYAIIKEPGLLKAWIYLFYDYKKLLYKRKVIMKKKKKEFSEIYRFFN
jgi:GT2 family glycosyltransferase